MTTKTLLRNSIGKRSILELSERILCVLPEFESLSFEHQALDNIEGLGLNERIKQVVRALKCNLPVDFHDAASVLIKSLAPPLQQNNVDGIDLGSANGFINLAIGEYVAEYGQQHFELSMIALEQITQRFTAEGAIRRFIQHHPEATLAQLRKWLHTDNVHLRRLVSEGTRPRLPMFSRLPEFIENPAKILSLLEELKDDPELYVRRSVANNINDISKDNPELVIELLERWVTEDSANRRWLIKHALRTLIKKGHPKALSILGFKPPQNITLDRFLLDKQQVKLGESIKMSVTLTTTETQPSKLLIDYVIQHKKANGSLSPKVFKWTQTDICSHQPVILVKQHPIKVISTRKYYPGEHEIHLQINGQPMGKQTFVVDI